VLPEPLHYTVVGGLPVVLVQRHRVPLVSLELVLPGGTSLQRRGEEGLAALTADLLDEGTAEMGAMELAEALERLGAELETRASWDHLSIRLNVLRERMEPALRIMAEAALRPSFAPRELERVRRERINRVLQALDDPERVADDTLAGMLYGEGHPYGAPLLGSAPSLEALEPAAVRRLHREATHSDGAVLVVVGDVDPAWMVKLLDGVFEGWEGDGETPPPPPPPPSPDGVRVVLVDRPGSPQSEIRVGRPAASGDTPHRAVLAVLNTVLGGAFSSRLNLNLREEKGFTYGAASRFHLRKGVGPFVAQASVHTPATAAALTEFLGELERLTLEPVPGPELERARRYVALRLPQQFETVEDVAARFSELALHRLPWDHHARFVPEVLSVGAREVLEAARNYLPPGGWTIVVVGDRELVQGPLEELGPGSLEVVKTAREGG